MNLTRKEVVKTLKKVGGVINSKDALSFLAGVMLEPGKVKATNLRQSLIVDLPGSDLEGLVNFKSLDDLLKKTNEEEVDIHNTADFLVIETPAYRAECAYLDSKMFPEITVDQNKFKPLPPDFYQALALCADAASTDQSRYTLCGIHVNGKIVEATDGHRVARVTMSDGKIPDCIIPMEAVNIFHDLIPREFFMEDGMLWFRGDDFLFSTVLIQGKFPPISSVIPDKKEAIANMVLEEELFDGTDVLNVFDNSEVKGVSHRVTISIGESKMQMHSANASGSILFTREIDYDGDVVSFDVNIDYFLKAMKGESALFVFPGPRLLLQSGSFVSVVAGLEKE